MKTTILGLAIVAMLATSAWAEHLQIDTYFVTVPNVTGGKRSFNAWCESGDLPTGGGQVCPPGEHVQQGNFDFSRQFSDGVVGWKASCQTADGRELKPIKITVRCDIRKCAPDTDACYADQ